MTFDTYEHLAADLFSRCEAGVEQICHLAVDTGITFQISDIVRAVENDLPVDYSMPAESGAEGRRQMIERIVKDMFPYVHPSEVSA